MHASSASSQFDRVFQMEHLVVKDVFHDIPGHTAVVEDLADDDGVVRGIVVAKPDAGVLAAPSKLRTAHKAVEEAAVEVVENFFEMIVMAAGRADVFASAKLAHEARFGGEIVARDVASVAGAVGAIDRLAVELGQKDVRDGVENGLGRAFKQIRKADVKLSLAKPNRIVNGDEWIEADVHGGRRRAGAKFGIGGVEDFLQLWRHCEKRVASIPGTSAHASNQKTSK